MSETEAAATEQVGEEELALAASSQPEPDENGETPKNCFNCNGLGHWASQCSSMRGSVDSEDAVDCHICKGKGHFARLCPTSMRTISANLNLLAYGRRSIRGKGSILGNMHKAVQVLLERHDLFAGGYRGGLRGRGGGFRGGRGRGGGYRGGRGGVRGGHHQAQGQFPPDIVCNGCHQMGHIVKFCPHNTASAGGAAPAAVAQ
eukprot:Nk52_evm40s1401 gene=Nk52_evmTU40s1401